MTNRPVLEEDGTLVTWAGFTLVVVVIELLFASGSIVLLLTLAVLSMLPLVSGLTVTASVSTAEPP